MDYQVLARKWRPKTFADVIGQKHVLNAIVNGLLLKRIHQAWLFSGTRGVGKTSIARLLTKSLNCETGITSTPCCVCSNCKKIEDGRFVDLIEIDAASRTKVEDTRELLDNVQYAPVCGRFKVYLIDEVHMLSRYSFNALLKTLEEPPIHTKFLFATTDSQKLPMTILSRCLQFHLKALNNEQICNHIKRILIEEQISSEPRALQLLASAAKGSLRDALNLTDQAIASGYGKVTVEVVSDMLGIIDDDQALSLIEAIVEPNGERVMRLLNSIASHGIEWEALLIEVQNLLHRIAMAQLLPPTSDLVPTPDTDIVTTKQRILKLIRSVPPTDIQLYYQTFVIGRKELAFAPDYRTGVEMTMLRALAFHPKQSLSAFNNEISQSYILDSSRTATDTSSCLIKKSSTLPKQKFSLSENINQVLTAKDQLQYTQRTIEPETELKKNNSSTSKFKKKQLVHNVSPESVISIKEDLNKKDDMQPIIPSQQFLIKKKITTVIKK